MKKITILALAMLSIAALSCTKEETKEAAKSDACKLTSFVATNGTATLEGFIDQSAKTIELSYMPAEYDWLSNATAEVKISDNATIEPDPSVAVDYTKGASFTVTAEDGKTTAVYTVKLAPAEFSMATTQLWSKSESAMELGATVWTQQPAVAFSGTDIVFQSGAVVGLDGAKKGNLNLGSLDISGWQASGVSVLGTLTNDMNGVLVGFAVSGNDTTTIAAWKDGWNNAPVTLFTVEGKLVDGSASGDINGDFIVNWRATWDGTAETHVVKAVKNGDFENAEEYYVTVPFGCCQGNWQEMISFATGNFETSPLCGLNSYNVDQYSEDTEHYGVIPFVFKNASKTSIDDASYLYGTAGAIEYTGIYNLGNYTGGHIHAFRYNGQNYASIASSSWGGMHYTITKMDNLAGDDTDFLLPTTTLEWQHAYDALDDAFACSSVAISGDDAYAVVYIQSEGAALFKIGTTRL